MRYRFWPVFFLGATLGAQAAELRLPAGQAGPRILAFAANDWLTMPVGKFEPGKGWVQSTDFYMRPQPGETFTIFGVAGRLGEEAMRENRRPDPSGVPAAWHARIGRGGSGTQPFALAIEGSWPDAGDSAAELALDDPSALRIAADFLKKRGLKVDRPLLTQAYRADLGGDGQFEILICAHSDSTALQDDREGNVYALALLHFKRGAREKTVPLAAQTSWKTAHRTIDEHEHLYGKRSFYRFIAFHDIDGDGRRETVLYRSKEDAVQIDVFTFDGRRARRVLSSYRPNYN